MQSKATVKYLRIAPRKVRLLADLIRGKKVAEAKTILRFSRKGAVPPLEKALGAAVAGAAHNFQLEESNLYIAKLQVEEGAKLKRYRPRARGRAYPVQKKTSHITLVLDEIIPTEAKQRAVAGEAPSPVAAAGIQTVEDAKAQRKSQFRVEREQARAPKREGMVKRFFRRKAIS